MVPYYGDFPEDATVYIPINTFSSDDPSASVTVTNLLNTDVHIHKDGGTTQRNNAAGITMTIDYDSIPGNHLLTIDTNDNTVADFWQAGHEYQVRVEGITVDGATINAWVGAFSIERSGGALALLKSATYGLSAIKTETAAIVADTGTDGVVLAADAITAAKIADNAFSNEHFAAGALTSAEITSAAGCVVAAIANDAITDASINTGAFTADAFAADAIVAATLATGAITADAFAADAIVAATLATGALTADAFAADALVAATFATNCITTDALADGTITADKLGADCITSAKIADNALANEHFADGALTSTEITSAGGCVVASIANTAITAAAIANGAIDNATFAADVGSTAYATNIIALAAKKAIDEYDPPTNAEMEARTLVAGSYFDPAADTVAHVTLCDTTTTNTDMLTAAAVNAEVDTALNTAIPASPTADSMNQYIQQLKWVLVNKMAVTEADGATEGYKDDDSTPAYTVAAAFASAAGVTTRKRLEA